MHTNSRNIIVFGGTGFIGSRLVERLVLEEKANVTVVVNQWSSATWVSRLPVHLIQLDWNNENELIDELSRHEIVYHCIGIGGDKERCEKVNVGSLKAITQAAEKARIKQLVFLSSFVVYGTNLNGNVDENTPIQESKDPYADSKVNAEKWLQTYFSEPRFLTYTIIRPTFVWGPNSTYYSSEVVKQIKGNAAILVNHGKAIFNGVYVDNLVDLMLISISNENAKNELFLAVDDPEWTWEEYYRSYSEILQLQFNYRNTPLKLTKFQVYLYKFKQLLVHRKVQIANRLSSNIRLKKLQILVLKIQRKILKYSIRILEQYTPELSAEDRLMQGEQYVVSNEKAKSLLSFHVRVKRDVALNETKKWLTLSKQI